MGRSNVSADTTLVMCGEQDKPRPPAESEEMANLIKYQHSYTAAAKLITTADQMLQTLLGLKQ